MKPTKQAMPLQIMKKKLQNTKKEQFLQNLSLCTILIVHMIRAK